MMTTISHLRRKSLWFAALAGLGAQVPAHAALCTVSDSGTPVLTTVNKKPFTVPPPSTCLVNGLPGSAAFPGYRTTPVQSQSAVPLLVGSVQVGNYWDRVYCTGTSTTCDTSKTYLFATRIQMIAGPASHPACPVWSGSTTQCFEINDTFRTIPSAATGVKVGYWMGSSNSGNVDTQLAVKYLEYTGRTFQGLDPSAGAGAARTRDNTRIDFRTDVNISDPDGVNAPWSPWLYVQVTCPNGLNTTLTTSPGKYSVRFREGGEEGQIQTYTELAAYLCAP